MNFLGKLFYNVKRKNYKGEIRQFGDAFFIPGREYCKNEVQLKQLEDYKKYYLKEFEKMNIGKLNFNSNEIELNMNMNVDIILRLLKDNEDFYQLAPEELVIKRDKLKMYYKEMNALEQEIILRLIALNEIEEKCRGLRQNGMVLSEEISHLRKILEMYSYRKIAIIMELKKFNNLISTRKLEAKEDILMQRFNGLLSVAHGLYSNLEIEKRSSIKDRIVILERECEKYAYLNSNEVNTIKEKMNGLILEEINDNNKNDLLNTCEKIEEKLLLFYYYGDHLIKENDLRKLYEFKFRLLTFDIYSLKDSPIKETDKGFPYYKEIIENKLEEFIKNKNESLQSSFDINSYFESIIKYLKNKDGEYDCKEILLNKYKLSFLLALGYKDGIKDFFNKSEVNLSKNDLDEFSRGCIDIPGITWSNKFPLSSYFELMTEENKHPLYSLYENYVKEKNTLIVPDGVKSVDFEYISKSLHDKLKRKLKNLNLINCPSTLKKVSGYIDFKDYNERILVLNEGLKVIGPNAMVEKYLTIPSSVGDIAKEGNYHKFKAIVFSDFENSEIVNNRERFIEFLKIISKEESVGNLMRWYRPNRDSLEDQDICEEIRKKRKFPAINHTNFFEYLYPMYTYKLKPTVSSIYFQSNTLNNSIMILDSDLEHKFTRVDYGTYSLGYDYSKEDYHLLTGGPDFDMIYENVRRIILEKSNYDIYHEEKDKVKKKKIK